MSGFYFFFEVLYKFLYALASMLRRMRCDCSNSMVSVIPSLLLGLAFTIASVMLFRLSDILSNWPSAWLLCICWVVMNVL